MMVMMMMMVMIINTAYMKKVKCHDVAGVEMMDDQTVQCPPSLASA